MNLRRRRNTVVFFMLLLSGIAHGFLVPSSLSSCQSLSVLRLDQRQQLQDIVDRVNTLELTLETGTTPADDTSSIETTATPLNEVEQQISTLEQQLTQLEQLPLSGLTWEEFQEACWTILQLPVEVRVALWYALLSSETESDQDEDSLWESATNVQKIPTLVTTLYEKRNQLTPNQLEQGLLMARKRNVIKSKSTTTSRTTTTTTTNPSNPFSLFSRNNENKTLTPEEMRTESMIQQLLPRVTRQSDRVATSDDLDTVMNVLRHSSMFVPSSSQTIPGGYCIRGTWKTNRNTTATTTSITEQLKQLDTQFPPSFDGQLCWMPDIFRNPDEEEAMEPFGVIKDPVLLLTKREFTPNVKPILSSFTSLSAIATSIIFVVGIYGGNDLVTERLTQEDFSGIDWFNGKILDLLLPLSIIPMVHVLSQTIVAQIHKVQLSFPILLPFWPLPWMGTLQRLKNSPESRTTLANIALAGPLVGLLSSMALLIYGLQLTATAPIEVSEYFPTLPVRVLQLSTAGGTLVDSILGGAAGFYTSQISSAAIPLHPLAVAGYVSLLIQAVDLLPLGATNGGRLSLALLGRQGHSVIGGLTWLILLLASLSDANTDVLVGAWIVNNVVQNDPEVPCRNEVDPVGIPQALTALSLWFMAALILTPLI